MRKQHLINSKTVFQATLIVIPTVVLIVYVTGLHNHRSFYLNSLLSTSLLSLVFLNFITIGLYKGWKLKDTLGDFREKISLGKLPDSSGLDFDGSDLPDFGEAGIAGLIVSILLWLVVAVIGTVLLWFAGGVFWAIILLVAGLLYWIIFRAFRLVFKNSPKCKGNIIRSVATAIIYTILYNCWIYLIVVGAHFWAANLSSTTGKSL